MSSDGPPSTTAAAPSLATLAAQGCPEDDNLRYVQYDSNKESIYLSAIRQLISKDLSEPYSIYVYRYFLYQWGDLCYMVPSSLPPAHCVYCLYNMCCEAMS